MYRLLTTAYDERHKARRAELDECLRLNFRYFDEVTILAENMERPAGFIHGRWFDGQHRQQYADLLALTADADEQDVVIIANADIVLPTIALTQIDESIQANDVHCLTRWDVDRHAKKTLFDRGDSQDAWVFRGPVRQNIGGDYRFGVPGCDNRVAHELDAAGYRVLNPSKSIQIYHVHTSEYRTSNTAANRVPGPYLFVSPHKLGEQPTYKRPTRVSRMASSYQR